MLHFIEFFKATVNQLKTVLLSFYTPDELQEAKDLLINNVCDVSDSLLPRYPKRKGDNRAKPIVDDIIEIVSIVDENKIVDKLPRYAAINVDKIPSVRIEDTDIFSMAKKLDIIEVRLSSLDALESKFSSLEKLLLSNRQVVPSVNNTRDRTFRPVVDGVEHITCRPRNCRKRFLTLMIHLVHPVQRGRVSPGPVRWWTKTDMSFWKIVIVPSSRQRLTLTTIDVSINNA